MHTVAVSGNDVDRVIAGRYVVEREIGRGGMGVVWLAEDRTIGRRVAIKELHLPDDEPPGQRHCLELGQLDAGAFGQRGEHRLRWILVEIPQRNGHVEQVQVAGERPADP